LGLNQDPLLGKYAFLSITFVPAIRIEHVRTPSKGISTRNVFCIEPIIICFPIRPKSQIKFSTNWLQSILDFGFQNFLGCNGKKPLFSKKSKKIQISKFRPDQKFFFSEKSSSTKFLYPVGESMFKKSAKSEMVTGRLVDSYKKPLLKSLLFDILHTQNFENWKTWGREFPFIKVFGVLPF
jgi:hypothetical protein